ncbi:hypothetical protein G9A89_023876 [Geosiphon pyriformis]|nr:hypothetical protein G9A89_023876 [Geosiphon pyriformis]
MAHLFDKLETKLDKQLEKSKTSFKRSRKQAKEHFGQAKDLLSAGTVKTIKASDEKTWSNWARTINFEPKLIYHPNTLKDLKDIVRKAKKHGRKIRCAAEGRSWSTLSVTNDCLVLVSRMDKVVVSEHEIYGWVVTAEAGATVRQINETLRNHSPALAVHSMPVQDTFRAAGIVATGAHGSRTESRSVSDGVVSLQIVAANGELYEFSDEKDHFEMQAARVNLGLLGIIYKVTFRAQLMYNLRTIDFFPPIKTWLRPANIKELMYESDSIQIFYSPFNEGELHPENDKLWVKQWLRTHDAETPSDFETRDGPLLQDLSMNFGHKLYETFVKYPQVTPHLNNLLWRAALKPGDVVHKAPNAIHYQTEIDAIPYEELEFTFKADRDLRNVADEFNHVINRIYDYARVGKFPINLPLELRLLKCSNAFLASSYDEDPDTIYCFISIAAIKGTQDYLEFSIELARKWMEQYHAKPHWAKHWEYVPEIKPYLHSHLAERVKQFEKVRLKYDPQGMFFDNESLKEVFYGPPINILVKSQTF